MILVLIPVDYPPVHGKINYRKHAQKPSKKRARYSDSLASPRKPGELYDWPRRSDGNGKTATMPSSYTCLLYHVIFGTMNAIFVEEIVAGAVYGRPSGAVASRASSGSRRLGGSRL